MGQDRQLNRWRKGGSGKQMTSWESVASSQKPTDPQTISEQQPLWSQLPPPLSAPSTAAFIAEHYSVVWNTPLASSGHLSCLCPLPVCCPPQAYLLGEAGMMETEWEQWGSASSPSNHSWGLGAVSALFQPQIKNTGPGGLLWRMFAPARPCTYFNNTLWTGRATL